MSSNNPRPPRIPPKPVAPKTAPARPPQAAPSAAIRPATGSATSAPPAQEDIVARGAWDYRWKRYLMVLMLLIMAGWFGYDGYKGWPDENAAIRALTSKLEAANKAGDKEAAIEIRKNKLILQPLHSDTDILWQKRLAYGLPVLSAFMLAWFLYNSRGEYRLSGNVLSVPGHPPVGLEDILEVDKHLWDRKGIAYVICKSSRGKIRLRLDDFVYDRDPTDAIYARILTFMGVDPTPTPTPTAS